MIKLRLWHIVFFLIALVVFAVVQAPAALFARFAPAGVSIAKAEGTIWQAELTGLTLNGLPVERASWHLQTGQLLQGRVIGQAQFSGGGLAGDVGVLGNFAGDRRLIAKDLVLNQLPLAEGVALQGQTRARDVDVTMVDGRCQTAQGIVDSAVLVDNAALLGWAGPPLSGSFACVGENAEVAMTGVVGEDRVRLLLSLRPNGTGQWRAELTTARVQTQAQLVALGFAPDGGANTLVRTGEMRWVPF
jgi:hypothetical protein